MSKKELDRVRILPCCFPGCPSGGEAHHVTFGRGMSQKSDDGLTFPLCRYHHDAFHGPQWKDNPFRDWTREERRSWQEDMSQRYREDPDVF